MKILIVGKWHLDEDIKLIAKQLAVPVDVVVLSSDSLNQAEVERGIMLVESKNIELPTIDRYIPNNSAELQKEHRFKKQQNKYRQMFHGRKK